MDEESFERCSKAYLKRVAEHERQQPGYQRCWNALTGAVLAHGGTLVCPPLDPEPQAVELATQSQVWPGADAFVNPLRRNDCHANVAELWLVEGDPLTNVTSIATGYALSGEIWRQHTWGLIADIDNIYETTSAREQYFGVVLTDTQARAFAAANSNPSHPYPKTTMGNR